MARNRFLAPRAPELKYGPAATRVLAVGAHPDDLEILCGGTLVRYVQEGHEVVMCHATLGNRDSEINAADPDQRRAVVDLVREARPDVIITHFPVDYMSDHNEISKLVFDCSFHATLPLLATGKPYHGVVTPIYYMDTL